MKRVTQPIPGEIAFELDAYTPETLPMSRMAEYLAALASMLGSEASIHFAELESGSAIFRAYPDLPAIPKVQERIAGVLDGSAPRAALKAYAEIDDLLAADNAVGTLSVSGGKVIQFPGRLRPKANVIGPVRRDSVLEGQIYQIGGKDDTVNIHLRNNGGDVRCEVPISLARRLAVHLLAEPVRIFGEADWYRSDDGWTMKNLHGTDFVVLDQIPFGESLGHLREIFREIPMDETLIQELRRG